VAQNAERVLWVLALASQEEIREGGRAPTPFSATEQHVGFWTAERGERDDGRAFVVR